MGSDDLFSRVERAIIDSRLLRDERRILQQQVAKARAALRSAVLDMANVRAVIAADRIRNARREAQPESPIESDRLECVKTYMQSQEDVLRAFGRRMIH